MRILLPLLLLALVGCSPPQRIYGLLPVDREGALLPFDRVELLLFEDGSAQRLRPGQRLELQGDRVHIRDAAGDLLEGWPVSQLQRVEWTSVDGRPRRADVLTPDDLQRFATLPRIERVRLLDGSQVEPSAGEDERFRWSASALELELVRGQEPLRILPLREVESITLHQQSLLGSTLRSPAFWVASAAATGLFILVMRDTDDETVADR